MDLASAAEFDLAAAKRNIQGVRPGMRNFEVSAKTGLGMEEVVNFLSSHIVPLQRPAAV
jgi:hydrogenase nickel incorporation protein HypB